MKKGKRYKVVNYKRFVTAILILIAIICLIIFGIVKLIQGLTGKKENQQVSSSIVENKKEEVIVPKDITINFTAIGDVMCHSTNFKGAYDSETKTYDFSPSFKDVKKYILPADIAIGNLETTFAGEERGYSGYPAFNSPKELGIAVKNIGVDILSTANNHSLDTGSKGVISTLDTLDEIGISHTGTYRSKEEQDTILVKDVNGIKIAFISFTYGTNGIKVPTGKEYLVNYIDKNLMLEQIKLAKKQNVDLICASMHWGEEYKQKQNKEQENLADFLFENDVDIIIGNHAHVVEPMEKRTITKEDGTTKDVFVAYALGNFISGQIKEYTKSTIIINLKITKNGQTGKFTIDSVDYVPVYCNDKGENVKDRYELIDIREAMKNYESETESTEKISTTLYNAIKKQRQDIEKIIGDPMKQNED